MIPLELFPLCIIHLRLKIQRPPVTGVDLHSFMIPQKLGGRYAEHADQHFMEMTTVGKSCFPGRITDGAAVHKSVDRKPDSAPENTFI